MAISTEQRTGAEFSGRIPNQREYGRSFGNLTRRLKCHPDLSLRWRCKAASLQLVKRRPSARTNEPAGECSDITELSNL